MPSAKCAELVEQTVQLMSEAEGQPALNPNLLYLVTVDSSRIGCVRNANIKLNPSEHKQLVLLEVPHKQDSQFISTECTHWIQAGLDDSTWDCVGLPFLVSIPRPDSNVAVANLRKRVRDCVTPFLRNGWQPDEDDKNLYSIWFMDAHAKEFKQPLDYQQETLTFEPKSISLRWKLDMFKSRFLDLDRDCQTLQARRPCFDLTCHTLILATMLVCLVKQSLVTGSQETSTQGPQNHLELSGTPRVSLARRARGKTWRAARGRAFGIAAQCAGWAYIMAQFCVFCALMLLSFA
jgi:hypothetical protein